MLGPARPVASGRSTTIRASVRTTPARIVRTRWEWDDGEYDLGDHAWAAVVHARIAHRYANPGVYRVRLMAGLDNAPPAEDGVRYITVRHRGQFAASGWIRDQSGPPVPFGFLITPATAADPDFVVLRCIISEEEMLAHGLTWLFAGDPRSLHFGGVAGFGTSAEDHPYRVDVLAGSVSGGRLEQHVTISVYAPGAVPGRDGPLHRISGSVRPGVIDLGAALPARRADGRALPAVRRIASTRLT